MRISRPTQTLLIIPVVTFILACLLVNAFGPYYLGGNIDPEYVELFNAMSLLTFHIPPSTVHPGTTLHVLGAVVIFSKWLFSTTFGSWSPLEISVLLHPEDYLHAINLVVNILLGLAMFYAALAFYRHSGSLWGAVALQASFFLFSQTASASFRVSPEPLLIVVGFALMIPLARLVFAIEPIEQATYSRTAIACGALVGLGLVTKADFLGSIAIILLFEGYKIKLRFALAMIVSGLVFLLPSMPEFSANFIWPPQQNLWGDSGSGSRPKL